MENPVNALDKQVLYIMISICLIILLIATYFIGYYSHDKVNLKFRHDKKQERIIELKISDILLIEDRIKLHQEQICQEQIQKLKTLNCKTCKEQK